LHHCDLIVQYDISIRDWLDRKRCNDDLRREQYTRYQINVRLPSIGANKRLRRSSSESARTTRCVYSCRCRSCRLSGGPVLDLIEGVVGNDFGFDKFDAVSSSSGSNVLPLSSVSLSTCSATSLGANSLTPQRAVLHDPHLTARNDANSSGAFTGICFKLTTTSSSLSAPTTCAARRHRSAAMRRPTTQHSSRAPKTTPAAIFAAS
jgi:hypothetical protein